MRNRHSGPQRSRPGSPMAPACRPRWCGSVPSGRTASSDSESTPISATSSGAIRGPFVDAAIRAGGPPQSGEGRSAHQPAERCQRSRYRRVAPTRRVASLGPSYDRMPAVVRLSSVGRKFLKPVNHITPQKTPPPRPPPPQGGPTAPPPHPSTPPPGPPPPPPTPPPPPPPPPQPPPPPPHPPPPAPTTPPPPLYALPTTSRTSTLSSVTVSGRTASGP